MARTKKSMLQEQPALSIHSFSLAPDVVKTLQRLSRDASDFVGWPISSSAIVRALVRHVEQQAEQHGPAIVEMLFRQVEQELKAGVKWGKQTYGIEHPPHDHRTRGARHGQEISLACGNPRGPEP